MKPTGIFTLLAVWSGILVAGVPQYNVQKTALWKMNVPSRYSKYIQLNKFLDNQNVQKKNVQKKIESPHDCESSGGAAFCGRCIFVPYLNATRDIDYDNAIAKCRSEGGELAELRGSKEHSDLTNLLVGKLPGGRSWVYLWIGMKYDNETSTLQYRSGEKSPINPYLWYQYYPNGSEPQIMAKVWDLPRMYALLWNQPREYNMHGVVCEKKFWGQ